MATAAVVENDYIVRDITQADYGRAEIAIAETEMPGLMALARGIRRLAAAQGRADHRLAAHDHPDRGADRDARRARRRACAGRPATSSRPRTTPPRRSPREGIPVFAIKGESLAEYWDYVGTIFDWGDDDDLQHDPRRRRRRDDVRAVGRAGRGRRGAVRAVATPRKSSSSARSRRSSRREAGLPDQDRARRSRASRKRPPPASTGSTASPSRASCRSRRST